VSKTSLLASVGPSDTVLETQFQCSVSTNAYEQGLKLHKISKARERYKCSRGEETDHSKSLYRLYIPRAGAHYSLAESLVVWLRLHATTLLQTHVYHVDVAAVVVFVSVGLVVLFI
jgi:hypothetical protein